MRLQKIDHEFVQYIPSELEEGKIYVTVEFATAVHKCCCGCGNKVVTPLSPMDWELSFNGESISLEPSIGNWSFPCQSHYWIKRNQVRWAQSWSQSKIDAGRARERLAKEKYFEGKAGGETTGAAELGAPQNRVERPATPGRKKKKGKGFGLTS